MLWERQKGEWRQEWSEGLKEERGIDEGYFIFEMGSFTSEEGGREGDNDGAPKWDASEGKAGVKNHPLEKLKNYPARTSGRESGTLLRTVFVAAKGGNILG